MNYKNFATGEGKYSKMNRNDREDLMIFKMF